MTLASPVPRYLSAVSGQGALTDLLPSRRLPSDRRGRVLASLCIGLFISPSFIQPEDLSWAVAALLDNFIELVNKSPTAASPARAA